MTVATVNDGSQTPNDPVPPVVVQDGEFVCSTAVDEQGQVYTASHCVAPDGSITIRHKEKDHFIPKDDIIKKGDIAILKIRLTDVRPPVQSQSEKEEELQVGDAVVLWLGGFTNNPNQPTYYAVRQYVVGFNTSKRLGLDWIDEDQPVCITSGGAFGGCSGSGVYYKGRLVGIVSGGYGSSYTIVVLL